MAIERLAGSRKRAAELNRSEDASIMMGYFLVCHDRLQQRLRQEKLDTAAPNSSQ